MIPFSLAYSLALKVDESELTAAYKNRGKEFDAAVYEVVDKYDIFRLMDPNNKLEVTGMIRRNADEFTNICGEHTVAQHFDATFPFIKRMPELPCVKAYSNTTYRMFFPFEELAVLPKLDRIAKMASLVDVFSDLFWISPKWLGTRLVDYRNWQAASFLLASFQLRTTHLKHNKEVVFGYLDLRGSSLLPAYNDHLGVTVRQHFYSRHRVELRHPYLPCVAVNGANGQKAFLPLEVLKVVN